MLAGAGGAGAGDSYVLLSWLREVSFGKAIETLGPTVLKLTPVGGHVGVGYIGQAPLQVLGRLRVSFLPRLRPRS